MENYWTKIKELILQSLKNTVLFIAGSAATVIPIAVFHGQREWKRNKKETGMANETPADGEGNQRDE
ncbi:MAG: hypothetical protein ACFFD4_29645 [Candidatus Odinarchaeota archaeon]